MPAGVAIIDSGGANIGSVRFALERLGAEAVLTADAGVIRQADRVILPGVGSAAAAMQKLKQSGLDQLIPELQQPVLGICLGLQLLFEGSAEGDTECLGIVPATVVPLPAGQDRRLPQMGWNTINPVREDPLLGSLDAPAWAYFVHGFAAPPGPWTIAVTEYGMAFTAMLRWRNFRACQFHPERSAESGAAILDAFLNEDLTECN